MSKQAAKVIGSFCSTVRDERAYLSPANMTQIEKAAASSGARKSYLTMTCAADSLECSPKQGMTRTGELLFVELVGQTSVFLKNRGRMLLVGVYLPRYFLDAAAMLKETSKKEALIVLLYYLFDAN